MYNYPGYVYTYGYMDTDQLQPFPDEAVFGVNYCIPRVYLYGQSYYQYTVSYMWSTAGYQPGSQVVGFYAGAIVYAPAMILYR